MASQVQTACFGGAARATAIVEVSFSIVSHGHGPLLRNLLWDLRALNLGSYEVLLTLNVPENENFLNDSSDLPLQVIRNDFPKGFGANHNAAFAVAKGRVFAVVNPDVRLSGSKLDLLFGHLNRPEVGVVAPYVYSSRGELQDSARKFPTITRLLARRFRRFQDLDYPLQYQPFEVDWVAGMFMCLRKDVFSVLSGFDQRFYMYLEDADLCRRVRQAGLQVIVEPRVSIVHDAQRASHRNFRHLRWHISSAIKYLVVRRTQISSKR